MGDPWPGCARREYVPVNAVSSMALGWGVAAAPHLAVGSPLGLPSAAEVTEWIADLHVAVADIIRAPSQEWGVEQFTGRDPTGKAIELSVYGRDASDARVLAKLWRFAIYRDSGPTLIMDRLQQVPHEYHTLCAARGTRRAPNDCTAIWKPLRPIGASKIQHRLSEVDAFDVCCGSDVWEAQHAERVAQTEEGGDGGNE